MAGKEHASLELTDSGEVRALDGYGRFLLRVFGADRLIRLDAWLTKVTTPKPRCPWTSPGGSQCVIKAGHRGICMTAYYVNCRLHHHRTWYGINYTVTDEPPG